MKESAKWQRWKSNNTTKEGDILWHSTTQKKSNKDDAKENSFKVTIVPCLVSLKFDQEVLIFFDCGYELKLESSFTKG